MLNRRPYIYALVGAAIALLIGTVMLINRGLREHDIIISSPSPPGVFVDGRLPLKPGDQACIAPVRFTPAAGRIRLVVQTQATPVPDLIIRPVTAAKSAAIRVGDYPSGKVTAIIVPFSVKRPVAGSVCVRNAAGRGTVALASTDEARYASLTKTKLNGKPTTMQASLQLLTPEKGTIFERVPDAVRQDAQLTGVLPRVLVWLLIATVLVAIVAVPLYAMTDTLRSDEEQSD